MDQLPIAGQLVDPVEALLGDIVEEAMIEIIANKDSSLFWTKLKDHLYDTALISFEENYNNLIADLGQTPDAFDYFVRFVQRVLAKPYCSEALRKVESTRELVNKTAGLDNMLVVTADNKDQVKPICYMLAVYAPITMYRINVIGVDKGEE